MNKEKERYQGFLEEIIRKTNDELRKYKIGDFFVLKDVYYRITDIAFGECAIRKSWFSQTMEVVRRPSLRAQPVMRWDARFSEIYRNEPSKEILRFEAGGQRKGETGSLYWSDPQCHPLYKTDRDYKNFSMAKGLNYAVLPCSRGDIYGVVKPVDNLQMKEMIEHALKMEEYRKRDEERKERERQDRERRAALVTNEVMDELLKKM